jgi:phosphatidylserine decarboxylase
MEQKKSVKSIRNQVWNYQTKKLENEVIFSEGILNFIYRLKLDRFNIAMKVLSKMYGIYNGSSFSRHKIKPFIKVFSIDTNDFKINSYDSFNAFFSRELKPEARPFAIPLQCFPAFCEGRYLIKNNISPTDYFKVKGQEINLLKLIGDQKLVTEFSDGTMILARLALQDYHRFHFPDNGEMLKEYAIPGCLDSVGPVGQKYKKDILLNNARRVGLMRSENFGTLLYIEIGAFCVGSIIQTNVKKYFNRGDEKGYFNLGGSTIIVIASKGQLQIEDEIVKKSNEGIESYIKLGTSIGKHP